MSYDVLICVFLMLVFCFFMQVLTIKVMISMLNAKREDGEREIKQIKIIDKPAKKTKAQIKAEENARKQAEEWNTIMRNLEVYDGTELGQEDIK